MNGRHFEIADDADKLFNLPQFDSFHWGQYPLFTKLIVVWYLMVTNKNITISPSRSELQEPYAGLSLPIVEASRSQSDTTLGTTPLDEWSDRRRDLYLTTHNTHTRQISMLQGGIRTRYLSRRAAADLRLRPRDNWEMFLIQRRIQRGNVTNVYWSSCQVLLSLVRFRSNVNFLERF